MIPDLPIIPGVPPQLLTALNYRFRMVPAAQSSTSTAATRSQPGESNASTGSGGSDTVVIDVTLSSGVNTPISAPPSGRLLIVIVRQLAAGTGTISWNSGFSGVGTDIPQAPTGDTVSVFLLAFSTTRGVWIMAAQPTNGMAP